MVFIAYPESLPLDFISILEDEHVPCAISPLHDLDVNENGEFKKQHYHIILAFDGKKSYRQVCEITDKLNASMPQPVNSVRSYYRYLCHLDSNDKAKYDVNDIILLSGFNPQNYIDEQVGVFTADMMNFIIANNVTSFAAFTEYCFKSSKGLVCCFGKPQEHFFQYIY